MLAWNVQGLNKDSRINEVKMLMEAKKIDLFGLNETKIKGHWQEEVMRKFGSEWEIHTNLDKWGT